MSTRGDILSTIRRARLYLSSRNAVLERLGKRLHTEGATFPEAFPIKANDFSSK